MANANDVLNIARAWLGKKESDGSHMEIVNVYNSYTPLPRGYKVKSNDNWCATFVSACFIKAGLAHLCPLECSCGNMIANAKTMGIWEENDDIRPSIGDLIMYDWDKKDGWPEHVGIVEGVSGNSITVIEGNKSDKVARRTIAVGNASIRGYVQPKYSGATANPTPPVTDSGTSVNYDVKVNTKSGVNCRTKPSTSGSKITAYTNGTVLHVTKEQGDWLFVNNTGWVSGEYCIRVSGSTSSGASNSIIAIGQQHSINFTGHGIATDGIYGKNTKANGIRCVQNAMNLDYGAGLDVDGKWGTKSNRALGSHWVKQGETQYMVTALEILLMLRGYDPHGVECPGQFASGLKAAVKQYQSDAGLKVDGVAGVNTFKSLMGV